MDITLEAKFEGARFDERRWYVEGFADSWFTSKKDAEEAIKLALQVAFRAEDDLSARIRDMLP